jgi:hypothetical protein
VGVRVGVGVAVGVGVGVSVGVGVGVFGAHVLSEYDSTLLLHTANTLPAPPALAETFLRDLCLMVGILNVQASNVYVVAEQSASHAASHCPMLV